MGHRKTGGRAGQKYEAGRDLGALHLQEDIPYGLAFAGIQED